jgi:hypothetical protein
MHTIIKGQEKEYASLDLKAKFLLLKDGTRYTFDIIDLFYGFDAPDVRGNLIEVESLAFGDGKWMLGKESLVEGLDKIEQLAHAQLNMARSKVKNPPISLLDFNENVLKSPQLYFKSQSKQENDAVLQINSVIFNADYIRRWQLRDLLQVHGDQIKLRKDVCAVAWFEGNDSPVLLHSFQQIKPDSGASNSPAKPDINETLLWHIENKIRDELDPSYHSAPAASLVFIRYCRDRMKLVDMSKKFGWKLRTLKARKADLKQFLANINPTLTLESFFVDRRIFSAAERQAKEHHAKRISMRELGEFKSDEDDD